MAAVSLFVNRETAMLSNLDDPLQLALVANSKHGSEMVANERLTSRRGNNLKTFPISEEEK